MKPLFKIESVDFNTYCIEVFAADMKPDTIHGYAMVEGIYTFVFNKKIIKAKLFSLVSKSQYGGFNFINNASYN